MNGSIWATVEFFCIAADLDHENYLRIIKSSQFKHQPLGQTAYDFIRCAFNAQMMEDKDFKPEDKATEPVFTGIHSRT